VEYNTNAGTLRLIGGRLCLDFVNTANNHEQANMKEHLTDYAALAVWACHASALAPAAADRLLAEARVRPADAARALERARELRRGLYALFQAFVTGQPIVPERVSEVNAALARLPGRASLLATPAGLAWDWSTAGEPLDQPILPVLWSGAELLTSPERARIRMCEGQGCTWLFLDTSRNRARRWCSMEDCGNRAKAQRHYARHHGNSV
jgi:predicted RNA-binding Zn ribbon-like protein